MGANQSVPEKTGTPYNNALLTWKFILIQNLLPTINNQYPVINQNLDYTQLHPEALCSEKMITFVTHSKLSAPTSNIRGKISPEVTDKPPQNKTKTQATSTLI